MARPRKQTVDYFPHDTDANHRKTLTVLQNKYGNDGYAFWYQLLELLGRSPGHFYNFNEPADWEFLIAETHISESETVKSILDTLAILQAIDPELHKQGIIWSQNFVDRLEDVYNKREERKPDKPVIGAEMPVSVEETIVSDDGNTQIKVNKIKENIKEDEITNSDNNKITLQDAISAYEELIAHGDTISEDLMEELKLACRRFPPYWVVDAIKEAAPLKSPRMAKMIYMKNLLQKWGKFGKPDSR